MKTKHTLAALALAATLQLPAAATSEPLVIVDWGAHPDVVTDSRPFFDAQDFYFDVVARFTLDGSFDLLAQAGTDGRPLSLGGAMVTLWRDNGDDDYRNDELLGGFDFDASGLQQRFGGIGSGSYFYLIEGVATGSGNVLFTSSISAVPEPGQWALLLGGLGFVARVARRRLAT